MSKGSARRPCLISPHEEELRWKLAQGDITRLEFDATYTAMEAMRHNTIMEFCMWCETAQNLCKQIGKKYFERWDGVLEWIPAAEDGEFVPTFIYRLRGI